MNLEEILKKEKIEIEEITYDVCQYGKVDIMGIKNWSDFSPYVYRADNLDNEYENAETHYDIYKNNNILHKNLSEDDVRKFLKNLEEQYNEI